ncbi:hypothetical protein L7F22_012178 [Adiantum nelumboides]|nr:hypothetical protein [Adiantum nelumboides]
MLDVEESRLTSKRSKGRGKQLEPKQHKKPPSKKHKTQEDMEEDLEEICNTQHAEEWAPQEQAISELHIEHPNIGRKYTLDQEIMSAFTPTAHVRGKLIEASSQRSPRKPFGQALFARSPAQTPTRPPPSKASVKQSPIEPTNKKRKKRVHRQSDSGEGDEDIEEDPEEEEIEDVLDKDLPPFENLDREDAPLRALPDPLLGLTLHQSFAIMLLTIQVVSVLGLEFTIRPQETKREIESLGAPVLRDREFGDGEFSWGTRSATAGGGGMGMGTRHRHRVLVQSRDESRQLMGFFELFRASLLRVCWVILGLLSVACELASEQRLKARVAARRGEEEVGEGLRRWLEREGLCNRGLPEWGAWLKQPLPFSIPVLCLLFLVVMGSWLPPSVAEVKTKVAIHRRQEDYGNPDKGNCAIAVVEILDRK